MIHLFRDLIIILICGLFYYRTLRYGYVSDDIPVAKKQEPKAKNKWWEAWYELTSRRNFDNKRIHIIVSTLHLLTCLAIYHAFGANNISFVASLFFCVNPVNLYCSVWGAGKGYTIGTLMAIMMFIFPYFSPLFFYVGLTQSNNLLFAPLLFLLTKNPYMAFVILMAIPRIKEIFSITHNKFTQETNKELLTVHHRKLIPYLKTFGYYFILCLVPHKIALYHDFLYNFGVDTEANKESYRIDKHFWIGLGLFILCIASYFYPNYYIKFGLFWFLINISMWSNAITMQQQIAQRYCYIANVGLMLALSSFILSFPHPIPIIIFFSILVFYSTRLWWLTPSLYNEFWNVEYNIIEAKNLHYAWLAKGVHKFGDHNLPEAHLCLMRAKELRPKDFKTNFNLSQVLLLLGRVDEALKNFEYTMKECTINGREDMIKEITEIVKPAYEEIAKQVKEKGTAQIDMNKIKLIL